MSFVDKISVSSTRRKKNNKTNHTQVHSFLGILGEMVLSTSTRVRMNCRDYDDGDVTERRSKERERERERESRIESRK